MQNRPHFGVLMRLLGYAITEGALLYLGDFVLRPLGQGAVLGAKLLIGALKAGDFVLKLTVSNGLCGLRLQPLDVGANVMPAPRAAEPRRCVPDADSGLILFSSGITIETGSDAGKVFLRASSSTSSWCLHARLARSASS
jgi:hypothetical protein